jgi:Undecaprenyl-phosphate glucose phosphotransferase
MISFFVSYYLKFHSLTFSFAYLMMVITIITFWFLIAASLKCYDAQRSRRFIMEIELLIKANFILLALMSLPLFYFHNYFSRGHILIFFALCFTSFIGLRGVVRLLLRYIRKKGYNTRRLLIVGGGPLTRLVVEKVNNHPEFGYMDPIVLADVVSDDSLGPLVKGAIADLSEVIKNYDVDDVIVAFPLTKEDEIFDIVKRCEAEGVRVRIALDFIQIIPNRLLMEDIDNVPLIGLRPEPLLSLWNRTVKRSFDVAFSAAMLLVLSPLFIVVALLVKATSRGPVFFVQDRIGTNNRPFHLYKFRTMRVQSRQESDRIWTTKDDSRVTIVGRVLRKTNIDELPQFYNVLVGDMSVVGPRPEREFFADRFATEISAYRIRHLVRVGITGWAQVNGLRGDTSISERVKHDLYYLENWSFWFDVRIILKTVFGGHKNAM